MSNPTELPEKYRKEFLNLALDCGAVLTGKPDGSEAITVVFSIEAWRKFDMATQRAQHAESGMHLVGYLYGDSFTAVTDADGFMIGEGLPLYELTAQHAAASAPELEAAFDSLESYGENGDYVLASDVYDAFVKTPRSP